eukprot:g14929.t1
MKNALAAQALAAGGGIAGLAAKGGRKKLVAAAGALMAAKALLKAGAGAGAGAGGATAAGAPTGGLGLGTTTSSGAGTAGAETTSPPGGMNNTSTMLISPAANVSTHMNMISSSHGSHAAHLTDAQKSRIRRQVAVNEGEAGTLLKLLKPTEYFGELALLSEAKRTASAMCATDVDCLVMRKSVFTKELDKATVQERRAKIQFLSTQLLQGLDMSTSDLTRLSYVLAAETYPKGHIFVDPHTKPIFSGVASGGGCHQGAQGTSSAGAAGVSDQHEAFGGQGLGQHATGSLGGRGRSPRRNGQPQHPPHQPSLSPERDNKSLAAPSRNGGPTSKTHVWFIRAGEAVLQRWTPEIGAYQNVSLVSQGTMIGGYSALFNAPDPYRVSAHTQISVFSITMKNFIYFLPPAAAEYLKQQYTTRLGWHNARGSSQQARTLYPTLLTCNLGNTMPRQHTHSPSQSKEPEPTSPSVLQQHQGMLKTEGDAAGSRWLTFDTTASDAVNSERKKRQEQNTSLGDYDAIQKQKSRKKFLAHINISSAGGTETEPAKASSDRDVMGAERQAGLVCGKVKTKGQQQLSAWLEADGCGSGTAVSREHSASVVDAPRASMKTSKSSAVLGGAGGTMRSLSVGSTYGGTGSRTSTDFYLYQEHRRHASEDQDGGAVGTTRSANTSATMLRKNNSSSTGNRWHGTSTRPMNTSTRSVSVSGLTPLALYPSLAAHMDRMLQTSSLLSDRGIVQKSTALSTMSSPGGEGGSLGRGPLAAASASSPRTENRHEVSAYRCHTPIDSASLERQIRRTWKSDRRALRIQASEAAKRSILLRKHQILLDLEASRHANRFSSSSNRIMADLLSATSTSEDVSDLHRKEQSGKNSTITLEQGSLQRLLAKNGITQIRV